MRHFLIRRRWALLFLNVVAGLCLAPFIYWDAIFMRVVLAFAHENAILLGLNSLNALGSLLLILLAAPGVGGCLSAFRKILNGTDGFLPGEVLRGTLACAKTSLLAGGIAGLSLGTMHIGLMNLHMLQPPGILRAAMTAILVLQLLVALPFCVLALTQSDALQRRPLRALAQAGRAFAAQPLRWYGLLICTALPVLIFFMSPLPAMKLLGFLGVMLFALIPIMLAWQKRSHTCNASHKPAASFTRTGLAMLLLAGLSSIALAVPVLSRARPHALRSTLSETLSFILRQALLEADNGSFRELLSASSVWPLLAATLLGSACCILVAYACACYQFRLRGLVFSAVVLLQLLPMLSRYSALELLLRNLNLQIPSVALGLSWALLYILATLLLYRHFKRMLPKLQKNQAQYPGVRLFFYYAFPRARLHVIALTALATIGCWSDALAPFWLMRELGAFSLTQYILF